MREMLTAGPPNAPRKRCCDRRNTFQDPTKRSSAKTCQNAKVEYISILSGRLFSFSSEGLGSKVANSKAAEHDVCSRLCNQFQLLLENSELDS